MSKVGLPLYGQDLASALEAAKKLIKKIEKNKFTNQTLLELAAANEEIIKYAVNKQN